MWTERFGNLRLSCFFIGGCHHLLISLNCCLIYFNLIKISEYLCNLHLTTISVSSFSLYLCISNKLSVILAYSKCDHHDLVCTFLGSQNCVQNVTCAMMFILRAIIKLSENHTGYLNRVLRVSFQKINQLISLRHSVNRDFCGHSRFVLWHENLTTFVSWTLAKSESWEGGVGLNFII